MKNFTHAVTVNFLAWHTALRNILITVIFGRAIKRREDYIEVILSIYILKEDRRQFRFPFKFLGTYKEEHANNKDRHYCLYEYCYTSPEARDISEVLRLNCNPDYMGGHLGFILRFNNIFKV